MACMVVKPHLSCLVRTNAWSPLGALGPLDFSEATSRAVCPADMVVTSPEWTSARAGSCTLRRPLCPSKREGETLSNSLQSSTVVTIKIIKGKTHCLQLPFEAISQTEFLSFDHLSQSSHIYLAGEAGTHPPMVASTQRLSLEHLNTTLSSPPGPVAPSTDHEFQHVSQNSHNHPLRRPLGSHFTDEKTEAPKI